MSKEKKHASVETITLESVPMEDRKSWIDVALIQAGIMICVPSLLLGGILAESMDLGPAILSGTVGYIIVSLLFCLMGIIGSDLGVPTCVTSVGGFGRKGAQYIVSFFTFISMIGWFAVQNSVCGNAFTNLISTSFHVDIPVWLSTAIWGIVMLVTAVYGINALDKLNTIAVPALFDITTVGCILSLRAFGTSALGIPVTEVTMSFADGVVLTVSFMAAGLLAASDVTRYQRTRRDTILSSVIGVAPAGILMIIMGAVMTKVANQSDITQVFCDVGMPILGMIVLIAATWTTNTTNAYSGGINAVLMLNLKDKYRAPATMVAGLIGTVCAILGFADHFEEFLYILGDIMLPMIGVIIADYWIVNKGDPSKFHFNDAVNVVGIVSWLIGYAVIKLIPAGVPFAQGIIAAMIVYVIGIKLTRKEVPAS